MTDEEERVLRDPMSTKYAKRAISARRAFRGASAAWMLRKTDPLGADVADMVYVLYIGCMSLQHPPAP